MKSLKNTQTEKNILTAFAGESQARNRYTFFASQARKDGFVEIADTIELIASQEKEHAKRLFKFLEGGDVEITAAFPAGKVSTTYDNLIAAAAGENHEHTHMYPEYADIADKEGFPEIGSVMRAIAIAEKHHEHRFLAFAAKVKSCTVFKRPTEVEWRCINCGCIVKGTDAPSACPACAHPQAYFEALCECVL